MVASQRRLLTAAAWDYLVILDGGRADIFEPIYQEYVDGAYQRAHNADHTFTATWFADHFDGTYDATLFHGGLPIHAFRQNPADYDEREHFATVTPYERYAWDPGLGTACPSTVTDLVTETTPDRAVIRYLQPHNPYPRYPDITTPADAAAYSPRDLREAYREAYRWVLSNIVTDLLPALDGTVVLTADHGQCFGAGACDQYLHGFDHDPHSHLVTVPFLTVNA